MLSVWTWINFNQLHTGNRDRTWCFLIDLNSCFRWAMWWAICTAVSLLVLIISKHYLEHSVKSTFGVSTLERAGLICWVNSIYCGRVSRFFGVRNLSSINKSEWTNSLVAACRIGKQSCIVTDVLEMRMSHVNLVNALYWRLGWKRGVCGMIHPGHFRLRYFSPFPMSHPTLLTSST